MRWRAFLIAATLLFAPDLAQAACPVGATCVPVSGAITCDSAGLCTVPTGYITDSMLASTFLKTSNLGTNVATALGVNIGSAGAVVVNGGAGGTPSSINLINATGYPAASTSTAGIAKLHNVPVSVGWIETVNPNNAVIAVINQASTISAIIGAVETATGGTATVSVKKAPSGTACSAGTTLHSGSFNANGSAATNQTLTVTTSSVAAGDRLCLQTTGTTGWTAGTGIGTITVFLAPS